MKYDRIWAPLKQEKDKPLVVFVRQNKVPLYWLSLLYNTDMLSHHTSQVFKNFCDGFECDYLHLRYISQPLFSSSTQLF